MVTIEKALIVLKYSPASNITPNLVFTTLQSLTLFDNYIWLLTGPYSFIGKQKIFQA